MSRMSGGRGAAASSQSQDENTQTRGGGYSNNVVQSQPRTHHVDYVEVPVAIQPVPMMMIGECPYCGMGPIQTSFTLPGILCAIFCFPLGVLFCFLMVETRCTYCGAYFA